MQLKISTTKIIVAVVVAFLAFDLWYAFVHLPAKAEAEWQAARGELIAKGEKLSIADYVPEKVPDERNFFADPIWAELSDREIVKNKGGYSSSKAKKPAEEWKISALRAPFGEAERKSLEAEFPEFGSLGGDKSRLNIIRRGWEKAREAGDSARGAEFVLSALAPSAPVVDRLRELGKRPDAYFPLVYQDGMAMSLEHAPIILHLTQWLDLHASALLAQGRTREAFADVQLIFRLAETLNREPLLVVVLVEMTAIKMGASVIARGIKSHAWTDAELLEFDRKLAAIDIRPRVAESLRLERAVMLEWTMPQVEKGGSRILAQAVGLAERNSFQEALARPTFWVYRKYWMPGDKILYSRTIQQWAEALDRAGQQGMRPGAFPDLVKEYAEANPTNLGKVRRIVSLLGLPALTGSFTKGANIQAEVFQTRLAIALERYRMKYGEYPEKLDAVVPEFLPAMPLDPVTMEPFLYRREPEGEFVLWSVGWNGSDENGTSGKKPYEGDWGWGK